MTVVDTSAIVAILHAEDEADRFTDVLVRAPSVHISAATVIECTAVLAGRSDRDPLAERSLDALLAAVDATVDPLSARQSEIARRAYIDFGKGSGHPAGLNLGDCFSYALAFDLSLPLLWKGDDFTHTGIPAAGTTN